MTQNAETPRRVSGAFQKSNAVVAEATVAHPSDTAKAETDDTAAIRDYWAAAKRLYLRGEYDDYGSDQWKALDIEDPRKLAGLVAFAELWRKYSPEIADDLNRQLAHPEPLWQRATTEACDLAFRQIRAKHERSRKEAA